MATFLVALKLWILPSVWMEKHNPMSSTRIFRRKLNRFKVGMKAVVSLVLVAQFLTWRIRHYISCGHSVREREVTWHWGLDVLDAGEVWCLSCLLHGIKCPQVHWKIFLTISTKLMTSGWLCQLPCSWRSSDKFRSKRCSLPMRSRRGSLASFLSASELHSIPYKLWTTCARRAWFRLLTPFHMRICYYRSFVSTATIPQDPCPNFHRWTLCCILLLRRSTTTVTILEKHLRVLLWKTTMVYEAGTQQSSNSNTTKSRLNRNWYL